mmetsp:Transcript_28660/g.52963  ORF Transcript_28660/g.52963 Transcript_28660/m.52963 type:complete len:212 (+) Transcript_28660:56-691(+)
MTIQEEDHSRYLQLIFRIMALLLIEISPRIRKDLIWKLNGVPECTQSMLRIRVRSIDISNHMMRNILHQDRLSFPNVRPDDVVVTRLFIPGSFQDVAAHPIHAAYGGFRFEARLAGYWVWNPWIYFGPSSVLVSSSLDFVFIVHYMALNHGIFFVVLLLIIFSGERLCRLTDCMMNLVEHHRRFGKTCILGNLIPLTQMFFPRIGPIIAVI